MRNRAKIERAVAIYLAFEAEAARLGHEQPNMTVADIQTACEVIAGTMPYPEMARDIVTIVEGEIIKQWVGVSETSSSEKQSPEA